MSTPTFRPFRTPIRGHAFAARPPETSGPQPGQYARLIREPTNPADRYAVGVWVAEPRGRWRIGYLDRGVAARLAPRLDRGAALAAQVDGWVAEPDGRWQRPVVVVLPTEVEECHAEDHGPGLWGRPPGVVRRPVGPR